MLERIARHAKDSLMSGSKMSSKGMIMYTMTLVVIFMIAIETTFNTLLIYKWVNGECEGDKLAFQMVFDATIYGYAFGLIGALSGINGWESIGKKKENK